MLAGGREDAIPCKGSVICPHVVTAIQTRLDHGPSMRASWFVASAYSLGSLALGR
jgi:hypothetical protein